MQYDRMQTPKKRGRIKTVIGTGGIVAALVVVFFGAVFWFRAPAENVQMVDSIAHILTPDPISAAVFNGIDTESHSAALIQTGTGSRIGTAVRGLKDGHFYLEINAALPEIERETQYYQVWLLRKLPYSFFSLGEMQTDEEGRFILEWEAPDDKNYADYTHVIITLNAYEGSADPGTHLVEGEFGK